MRNIQIKKRLLSLLLTLPFLSFVYAQFDSQTSQYMFNPAGYNAAAVGETNKLSVKGQHRLHWLGMPNGGSTTIFNINTPFKIAGQRQGVGINFVNDKVGQLTNQLVHLQYAYKFKIGKSSLSIGPQVGFVSIGIHGDSLRGPQVSVGDYHDVSNDPALPSTVLEGFGFDMGVGVWFSVKDFYAGASYSHVNQPVIDWSDTHIYRPASTLYLTGGYSFTLNKPKYELRPSLLFKTDFAGYRAELTALMMYDDQYWGGLSYRLGDAVVFLAGLHVGGGFRIGYSFDLPASQMIRASWGSHEVMISYEITIDKGDSSKRQSYKSIRIL